MNLGKLEAKNVNKEIEEYDPFEDPKIIAERRGQIVVVPKPNELFFDIDSEEQHKEFYRRFWLFNSFEVIDHRYITIQETESLSGNGHKHIILSFENKTFTDLERLAWQSALGDDPFRTMMSFVRIAKEFSPPITFFETKN